MILFFFTPNYSYVLALLGYLLLTELGACPYSSYLPIWQLNRQQETEMTDVATGRILGPQTPMWTGGDPTRNPTECNMAMLN